MTVTADQLLAMPPDDFRELVNRDIRSRSSPEEAALLDRAQPSLVFVMVDMMDPDVRACPRSFRLLTCEVALVSKKRRVTARVAVENLGYVEYDYVGPREQFGDHVVPKELDVTFPSDSESPRLEMRLAMEDGAATCRELRIVAKEGKRGVLPGDIRAVRLNEWIEDLFVAVAARTSVEETDPGNYRVSFSDPDVRITAEAMRNARRRGARRKVTDPFLAEVATVHQAARRAPTRAVADHFGVQHRTASLYIARARERGLLKKEA